MSSNDGMNFYEYEELLEQENKDLENELKHYGVGHLNGGHSGRWPWGSGKKNGLKTNGDPANSSTSSSENTPRKRSYKELSDKELREVNERTRLENEFLRQTYEKMKLEQGPQIQKGDSWLRKAANLTGDIRNLLSNLDQIANIFGFDVSKYITNKGGKEADLDLSKMSDDELSKFLKRLSNESAIKKLLAGR